MGTQESRKHHFVPRFLLEPWVIELPPKQCDLRAYWWDQEKKALICKKRGVKSVCFQLDLLTLRAHGLGRDAIERIFFGEIDKKGAIARDILIEHGQRGLSGDQRCDFARLLLSLEARRPISVGQLRAAGQAMAVELDADPEIRRAMAEHGIGSNPSEYVVNELGWCLEDRALTIIQKLVDNPEVGGRLINAQWKVRRIDHADGTLVLSDRPLIRIDGYDRPGARWVLPLTPDAAFIACNHPSNLAKLMGLSGQRFVKAVNVSSAAQAERFVFCVDQSHERWLKKHLRQNTRRPKGT